MPDPGDSLVSGSSLAAAGDSLASAGPAPWGAYGAPVPSPGAAAAAFLPQNTVASGVEVEMGTDGFVHVSGRIPSGLVDPGPPPPDVAAALALAAPPPPAPAPPPLPGPSAPRPRIKKRATYLRSLISLLASFLLPIVFTMCWMRTQVLTLSSPDASWVLYNALGIGAPLAFAIYGDLGGGDVDVVLYTGAGFMFAFGGMYFAFATLPNPPPNFPMYALYIAIACTLIGYFFLGAAVQLLLTWRWRWIVPTHIGTVSDEEFVWWRTSRRGKGTTPLTDFYYGDGVDHSRDTQKKEPFMPAIPDPEPAKKAAAEVVSLPRGGSYYPDDKSSIATRHNPAWADPEPTAGGDDGDEEEGFLWGSGEFGTLGGPGQEENLLPTAEIPAPQAVFESLDRPMGYNSLSRRSTNSDFEYPTKFASVPRAGTAAVHQGDAKAPWYDPRSRAWTDAAWASRYMVAKLLVWSHVAAGTWVMTIHMQSPESWRWFTCFMFPIIVGAQKSLATLAVRGMPEDLYHVIRFESHFLASLLYRLLFFVVRTTWTFIWVLFVEIVYKIFSIGIVYIPLVEEWRSHRYITWLFPAPERDPERRKRTIEEGFFYLQGADICTCLGVWILRAATGHIPTMSPEGDMQLKFNIMFLIQLLVELAIVPIYYFFARGVLKVKDFDPLTTGYAYLSRYQVQMTVFALACYQINLGMLAMGL